MNLKLFYTGLFFSLLTVLRGNGYLLNLLSILEKAKIEKSIPADNFLRYDFLYYYTSSTISNSRLSGVSKILSHTWKQVKKLSADPNLKIFAFTTGTMEPDETFLPGKTQNSTDKKLIKPIFMDKGFPDVIDILHVTKLNICLAQFRSDIWYTLYNRYFIILRI